MCKKFESKSIKDNLKLNHKKKKNQMKSKIKGKSKKAPMTKKLKKCTGTLLLEEGFEFSTKTRELTSSSTSIQFLQHHELIFLARIKHGFNFQTLHPSCLFASEPLIGFEQREFA